jgi:hypothetical protein
MSDRIVWVLVRVADLDVFDEEGEAFVIQEGEPIKVFQQQATAQGVRDQENQKAVGTGVYYTIYTVPFI